MRDKPPTPPATLSRAREIAIETGLRHVYTGNVHDRYGSSTYCPGCHACVIERDWYELGEWQLDAAGRCLQCGTQLPGVFDGMHGTWGAKRVPVRMTSRTSER
jgi:pyruvate formate lyase activating enzyme